MARMRCAETIIFLEWAMTDMRTLTTRLVVVPEGEPIFSDFATHIEIDDHAAGEFVVVKQFQEGYGKIGISPEDWPAIRKAIDKLVKACR
jgi:hypothetical protein